MPLFDVISQSTYYVTIGDVDYTVTLSPEDGQPVVVRHDKNGRQDLIPRPELGALICELIAGHLRKRAEEWNDRAVFYRSPAIEV